MKETQAKTAQVQAQAAQTKAKQVKNPKTVLHFIAIMLIAITMISSSFGLYAWARYISATQSNATAQVAKWYFNLKTGEYTPSGTQLLALTRTDDRSHVEEGKLAPGTSGVLPIIVDTTGTETDLEYEVTITINNCPQNMVFTPQTPASTTQTVTGEGTEQSPRVRTIRIQKYIPHAQTGELNETISWNWPYETTSGNGVAENDGIDTLDSGKEVTVTITAVGTEVLGESQSVTFNSNGGTGTMSSQKYSYGVPQALTTNAFTREHYTFTGWNTEPDGTGTSYTNGQSITITAATTLYAQWAGEQHTVTFNGNGGTGDAMAAQTFTYGTAQTLTANAYTASAANYGFGGWNTESDGSGTSYTNEQSINNLTSDITLYAQWLLSVDLGNGTIVNKNNVKNYLGKAVSYTDNDASTNLTYRLFYIDFDNKYKDGAGTVYLMADYNSSLTRTLSNFSGNYSSANASESTMKINQMNPLWAVTRGLSSVTWNNNEKSAAYLCDTDVWQDYANNDANYAIGGASTEMYIDSYNLSGIDTQTFGYAYQTSNTPGYVYTVDGVKQNSGWYTNSNTLESNKMYTNNGSGYWWLASPSASSANYVCRVSGNSRCLYRDYSNGTFGVRPLVSLRSGVTVTFTE